MRKTEEGRVDGGEGSVQDDGADPQATKENGDATKEYNEEEDEIKNEPTKTSSKTVHKKNFIFR